MATPAPPEDQARLLEDALVAVRQQTSLMRKCLDTPGKLMDALKCCSTLVSELRTSSLGPKQYYELYMAVFDALRYLSVHLRENHPVNHLADLYELVQYAGNIVPRLYLMVTVGTAYMGIADAPVKELMKDMMDMSRGVQHPIRGLFLRYYLSGQARDFLPTTDGEGPEGNLGDSINFILTNFVEMNKLWVRLQHQGHSRERDQRIRERKELQLLVGSNIVRLSQLVDLETYKSTILGPLLEQVVQCRDVLAQEYLLEVITQVFPDEYHLHTLDKFLGAVSRLNPHVNVKSIVIGLMDRLSEFAERETTEKSPEQGELEAEALAKLLEKATMVDAEAKKDDGEAKEENADKDADQDDEAKDDAAKDDAAETDKANGSEANGKDADATDSSNVQLYEVFFAQVKNLVEAQHLPVQDTIALLVSLQNLALNNYPDRLDFVDQILAYAATKTKENMNNADLHSAPAQQSLLALLQAPLDRYVSIFTALSLPTYVPLFQAQSYPTRRAVAGNIIRTLLKTQTKVTKAEQLENVLEIMSVLIKEGNQAAQGYPAAQRRPVETDETMQEQGWLARMVHLLHADDNDTQFKLLQMTRKAFADGGDRIRTTTPPLITACLRLARKFKAREGLDDNWETQSNALFKFMHSALSTLYTRVSGSGASEMALRLFCAAGQAADMTGFEEAAYEFYAQAFTVYEEAVSDSKAQFQAVCVIASSLHQTRNFGKENYDTLITKCAQHGSKLLRKPDQCRAVYLASHLWWANINPANRETEESDLYRDGKRVLECLQRALRVADSCMETATSIELFVEILDRYVTTKYLNGLIELIHSNLAGNQQESASIETSTKHFHQTLENIRSRQYEGVVLYPNVHRAKWPSASPNMPSEKVPFYDPTPPTYDEALAGSSRWVPPARDAANQRGATQTEQQSLLRQPGESSSSARGYRPPTVETDDEDSLLSDDDEEDQVRREIEEMEMEEPDTPLASWRKRLRLPSWKWSWRPRLPRLHIQLPARPADDAPETTETEATPRFNFQIPQVNTMFLVLTFARILALFIILGFFWFLFTSGLFTGLNSPLTSGMRFNAEDLRNFLQQRVEPMRIRASVQHYSNYAHLAGTEGDYAAARDVYAMFSKAGLDRVIMDEYFVYINYPRQDGRNVQLLDDAGNPTWTAKLDEDERHHETAGRQTFAFHAHSKSGDVKGPLVYVNYGSKADYEKIKADGIKTEGAIALVRDSGTEKSTALKVKLAEMHGFVGALVYNDPKDDGFPLGDVAPQGRFMPADGVHGGSVSLLNWIVGDVLTPQWESEEQAPRVKVSDAVGLVQIPSLPLAWRDAQPLLQSLRGHGQAVQAEWVGAVPDVEYWTGDASSPTVRLQNEQDEVEKQKIWNVYGRIEGMETASKSIILGNHRDSMGFGATNPHTGTAVMIELARIFGDLVDRGWKPLRSIEFMSWDAAEYNLIGSTEFVERNLDRLKKDAYAYIDLNDAVTGASFTAAGSPVLEKALMHALGRVVDPHANETLKTLWDRDNTQLSDLSTGADPSDYIPFQDIAGTSSIHLGFSGDAYPRRSSYDTFDLVDQVIDPGFVYHGLMGQVVGLLLLDLSDRAILPFDMQRYGDKLKTWLENLENWTNNRARDKLSFEELKDAAGMIRHNAESFGRWELEWDAAVLASNGWESNEYGAARTTYNDKMAQFETALLDPDFGGGIPNRTQFKHVVFGPPLLSTNDEALFPAIRDLIEAEDWPGAKEVMAKTAVMLRNAGALLSMSQP